jgi:DNA-binding response OmpR family regulator
MSGLTVLVVDDDPVIVRLLEVNFEMEGYRVITATNGEDAIARVRDDRPDVVVCDIMMPKIDGLEVVRLLRSDEATASVPLILLSAKAQSLEVQKGLDSGADDYVTKPFDPLELIERVNAVLDKPRG